MKINMHLDWEKKSLKNLKFWKADKYYQHHNIQKNKFVLINHLAHICNTFKNFIEFIRVTFVSKIIQISSAHLCIALCVLHPKSGLLLSPFIPFTLCCLPHTSFPSDNHHTVVCDFIFLFNPFTVFTQPPNPSPLWQLSACCPLYPWVCFYIVR